jgi:proteasome lid subunit RPN8/RPN11
MTAPLRLPRTIVNQILHQAQRAPDEEVCGLISGDAGGFRHCYPVANVATDKGRLFHLDPRGQIDAMRRMREAGEELLAIYHSHPHAPALPSATDIRESEYPDVLYLIISLDTQGVLELRGFRLHGGKVTDVPIAI